MILSNGKAAFVVVTAAGTIRDNGDPVPDVVETTGKAECNIVTKSKTNTAGDPSASFTRAAYEVITDSLPECARDILLYDLDDKLIDECHIQYAEYLNHVDAYKIIAYAKQR